MKCVCVCVGQSMPLTFDLSVYTAQHALLDQANQQPFDSPVSLSATSALTRPSAVKHDDVTDDSTLSRRQSAHQVERCAVVYLYYRCISAGTESLLFSVSTCE